MGAQLSFLLAALFMYGLLYWVQGGNKPKPATEGIKKSLGGLTNMGHDELFMSSLFFMLFNIIPFAAFPIPEIWTIIMRLTAFGFVGLIFQDTLSKKGSIELAEWIMGALIPQSIVIMVAGSVPIVTEIYQLMGRAFFGVGTGG